MPVGDSIKYGPVLYEARPGGEKVLKDWVLPLGASLVVMPLLLKWRNPGLEIVVIVVAVAIMFVLLTLLVVLLWLRKSRSMVHVTPTHVVRARMARQDVAARAELAEAVLVQRYRVPGTHSPVLFLTDASTRTRLQFGGPVWTEEQLRRIGGGHPTPDGGPGAQRRGGPQPVAPDDAVEQPSPSTGHRHRHAGHPAGPRVICRAAHCDSRVT